MSKDICLQLIDALLRMLDRDFLVLAYLLQLFGCEIEIAAVTSLVRNAVQWLDVIFRSTICLLGLRLTGHSNKR